MVGGGLDSVSLQPSRFSQDRQARLEKVDTNQWQDVSIPLRRLGVWGMVTEDLHAVGPGFVGVGGMVAGESRPEFSGSVPIGNTAT